MHRIAKGAAALVVALGAGLGPAAVAHAGDYTADGVRIRSNSNTSATILGLGYRSHTITPICYKEGTSVDGNIWWDRHRNNNTGVTGYSSMTLLTKWAAYHC